MDALVELKIITESNAFKALKSIIEAGSWLPKKECEERLTKWAKINCISLLIGRNKK